MARTYSAARIGLQPEHQERRQHAGLRGGGLRLAAGDQRPGATTARPSCSATACTWRPIASPRSCSTSWRSTSAREALREQIAAAGRAEAIEKHTYRHRMERLLGAAEEAMGRAAVGPMNG